MISRNSSLARRSNVPKLKHLEMEDQDEKSIYEADQWLETKKYGKFVKFEFLANQK
jgi:hypothetical protein